MKRGRIKFVWVNCEIKVLYGKFWHKPPIRKASSWVLVWVGTSRPAPAQPYWIARGQPLARRPCRPRSLGRAGPGHAIPLAGHGLGCPARPLLSLSFGSVMVEKIPVETSGEEHFPFQSHIVVYAQWCVIHHCAEHLMTASSSPRFHKCKLFHTDATTDFSVSDSRLLAGARCFSVCIRFSLPVPWVKVGCGFVLFANSTRQACRNHLWYARWLTTASLSWNLILLARFYRDDSAMWMVGTYRGSETLSVKHHPLTVICAPAFSAGVYLFS